MARRRPGRVRAGLHGRRTPEARRGIDGLSSRAMSEIFRLEHARDHLSPGDVGAAVRLWKAHAHGPGRRRWPDAEPGDVHRYCCGGPLEARALLDTVMRAMSRRHARELRRIVGRFDDAANRA